MKFSGAVWSIGLLLVGFLYLASPQFSETSRQGSTSPAPHPGAAPAYTKAEPTISGGLDFSSKTISGQKMLYIQQNYSSECSQVAPGVVRYGPWTCSKQDDGNWYCERATVTDD